MDREARLKEYRERIEEEYFEWIMKTVGGRKNESKLFHLLFDTEFIYILRMDANRADDGLDLRYRFGGENGYDELEIRSSIDIRPCSVLEMMTALAMRCEVHITSDPEIGDRTGEWFRKMLESLGLSEMDDSNFDESEAVYILNRFMRREYDPSGLGGLFTISDGQYDMRSAEIWYQMMWYLSDTLYGRR